MKICMNIKYISIPLYKLPQAEKKIAQLNRKAERLGCQTISLIKGRTYPRDIKRRTKERTGSQVFFEDAGRAKIEFITLMVTLPEIKISGWHFLAAVDQTSDGNIYRKLTEEEIPHRYRFGPLVCEHCNTNRNRKKYFVVKNKDDFRMVGSTCVHSYTGISISQVLLLMSFQELIIDLDDAEEEEKDYDENELGFSAESFFAVAISALDRYGYREKKNSTFTTPDIIFDYLFSQERDSLNPNYSKARKIIEWIKNDDNKADLTHNLKVIVANDFITKKHAPIAIKAIISYNPESEYVGEVGERRSFFDLTISKSYSFNTPRGVGAFVYAYDEDNSIVKWKSFTSPPFRNGSTISIYGEVEEHEEWKGIKRTIIKALDILT